MLAVKMKRFPKMGSQAIEFESMVSYAICQKPVRNMMPVEIEPCGETGAQWAIWDFAENTLVKGNMGGRHVEIFSTKEEAQKTINGIESVMGAVSTLGKVELARLRCLWTAYCIHHRIEYGSEQYLTDLRELWDRGGLETLENGRKRQYEAYVLFMDELLY